MYSLLSLWVLVKVERWFGNFYTIGDRRKKNQEEAAGVLEWFLRPLKGVSVWWPLTGQNNKVSVEKYWWWCTLKSCHSGEYKNKKDTRAKLH